MTTSPPQGAVSLTNPDKKQKQQPHIEQKTGATRQQPSLVTTLHPVHFFSRVLYYITSKYFDYKNSNFDNSPYSRSDFAYCHLHC